MTLPGFMNFRVSLQQRDRDSLDALAGKLLAVSRARRLDLPRTLLKETWRRWIQQAGPGLTPDECRALAAYAIAAVASGGGDASANLMQETQMSFNLQYLMLQEQMQNDSREYTCLSNVMKSRYDTIRGILANLH